MDEISEQEFNNLSFADKKKYLANNMWNALDKNDFSAWTESLGKFFSIHNEKIDKTVGITDLKKFIGELCDDSGLTNLVKKMCKTPLPTDVLTDLVIHQLYDEKAMDSAEIRVRMVKGVKDIAKDLVGAQGLEMAGIFGAIGKIASALPKVGKALEAGFVTVGGVDAASGAVNIAEGIATNNGELVSQGTGQAVMGGIMAAGGLRAGAKGRASAKAKAETAKDPAVETLSSKIDRSADVKRIKTEGIKGQYKDKNLKQSFDDVIAEIEAMPDIKEGKWDSQKEWGSIIVVDTGLPSKYDQIIFTKKVALKDGRTATYKLTKNIESGSAYKRVIFDEEGPTPTFTAYYRKANGKPESYNFSSKHGSQHFEYDGNGSLVDNSSNGYNSRYIEHHLSYSNYRQRNNGTVVRDKHLFDNDSRSTVIGTDGKVYKPYSYYGRNGKHITQSFFIDTKQILDANGNVIAEYGIETENYRVRFGKNEEPPAVVGVKIGDKHAYANLSKGGHIVLDNADVDPRTITLLDGTPIFDKFTVENGLYTATSKKITPESLGFKETPSMIDRAQNAKNNAVETLKNVPWKKVAKNGAKYAAKITGSVGIAGGFAALGLKNCHVVDGVDEGTYETNIVQEVNNVVDIDIEKEP